VKGRKSAVTILPTKYNSCLLQQKPINFHKFKVEKIFALTQYSLKLHFGLEIKFKLK
jgi:hypothetical protein